MAFTCALVLFVYLAGCRRLCAGDRVHASCVHVSMRAGTRAVKTLDLSRKLVFADHESATAMQEVEAERQRQLGSQPLDAAQEADAASVGGSGKVTELVCSSPLVQNSFA